MNHGEDAPTRDNAARLLDLVRLVLRGLGTLALLLYTVFFLQVAVSNFDDLISSEQKVLSSLRQVGSEVVAPAPSGTPATGPAATTRATPEAVLAPTPTGQPPSISPALHPSGAISPRPEILGIPVPGADWVWFLASLISAVFLTLSWYIPWAIELIQQWTSVVAQWRTEVFSCPWKRSFWSFLTCLVNVVRMVFVTLVLFISTILWVLFVVLTIVLVVINILGLIAFLLA